MHIGNTLVSYAVLLGLPTLNKSLLTLFHHFDMTKWCCIPGSPFIWFKGYNLDESLWTRPYSCMYIDLESQYCFDLLWEDEGKEID